MLRYTAIPHTHTHTIPHPSRIYRCRSLLLPNKTLTPHIPSGMWGSGYCDCLFLFRSGIDLGLKKVSGGPNQSTDFASEEQDDDDQKNGGHVVPPVLKGYADIGVMRICGVCSLLSTIFFFSK